MSSTTTSHVPYANDAGSSGFCAQTLSWPRVKRYNPSSPAPTPSPASANVSRAAPHSGALDRGRTPARTCPHSGYKIAICNNWSLSYRYLRASRMLFFRNTLAGRARTGSHPRPSKIHSPQKPPRSPAIPPLRYTELSGFHHRTRLSGSGRRENPQTCKELVQYGDSRHPDASRHGHQTQW